MNVASRIEGANKTLGTRFLASELLFNHVAQATVEGRRTQAALKGKRDTFKLVEVIGFAAPDPALLVQSTIGVLLQHQRQFTAHLYGRLFELDPGTQPLFRGNLETQGQMLSHMLQFLVYAMSRPQTMMLGLRDLGRRHDAYGVGCGHYPAFRQAFLDSARVVLGEKFTPQVEMAWTETIDVIIQAMLGRH
jgi:hemoglobin-like flavoprotein